MDAQIATTSYPADYHHPSDLLLFIFVVPMCLIAHTAVLHGIVTDVRDSKDPSVLLEVLPRCAMIICFLPILDVMKASPWVLLCADVALLLDRFDTQGLLDEFEALGYSE